MKFFLGIIKRNVGILLFFFSLLGIMPMTVSAATYNGNEVSADYSGTLTYGTDGNVIGYITPGAGTITKKSGDDDTLVLQLTVEDGWKFVGWQTHYDGPSTSSENEQWDGKYYFSSEGSASTPIGHSYSTRTASTIQINKEYWAGGISGCTYSVYAILKPVVSISTDTDVSYSFNGGSYLVPDTSTYSVSYNDNLTISYKLANNNRVVANISVRGSSDYTPMNYLTGSDPQFKFSNIKGPVWINVTTRLKDQKILFNANGGTGTMSSQTFSSGETRALSVSTFERSGYVFSGWNTEADGTGITYADQQSVTFTPKNDGDEITLYAQWTHSAHSGGEATCRDKAVCTICGESYGGTDNTKHTGTVSWTTKNETQHESKYSCCGAEVVALENHQWVKGGCSECGYNCTDTGGEATCKDKAVCTICGEPYGGTDNTKHAGGIEIRSAITAEEFKEGYTGDTYCLGCEEKLADGEVIPATHTHSYKTDWSTDKTNHWHECFCGSKANNTTHSYGDWVVTKEATMETEGSREKTCVCGHKILEPIAIIEMSNNPQTGDNSNIALWFRLGILSFFTITGLIVYDKKKRVKI